MEWQPIANNEAKESRAGRFTVRGTLSYRAGRLESHLLVRKTPRGPRLSLLRRLGWAWRLKVWPWNVSDSMKWIAWDQRLTESDIRRSRELAEWLNRDKQ